MQRRLAVALVLTALVAVVLVGFGILAIAQVGARNRAEDEVTRSLNVLVPLLENQDRPPGQLGELIPDNRRRDLRLERLEPVTVADDGAVAALRRSRAAVPRALADLRLTDDQVDALDDGGTVLMSGGGLVVGLRRVPDLRAPSGADRVALLAARSVTAIPRQTVVWFTLSSLVVLVGALVAGLVLADRLVRPIRDIEQATAAIAAGQLSARVQLGGDDELAQLAGSVNRMAADLERSRALDQQFLMSVSHDLRTPLTAIAGYAEALRDRAVDDPSEAGEIIANQAARLDRLVGDLLDLARLDANRFRLELRPVDLTVAAGRTAAGLAPRAADHGIRIDHPASPPLSPGPEGHPDVVVLADPDRLDQAVGNLITNAVAFAAGLVEVEVAAGDQWASVSVRDDGAGFSPEDLPHVFDRLYTGRARPRRAENPTGLGLAIVRELASAMGGSVEATNDPRGGARIVLFLPRHRTAPPGGPGDTLRWPEGAGPPPGPDRPSPGPPDGPSTWPAPPPSA